MIFNEDSRVKIPALLHLVRLGYTYMPRCRHSERHEETNIFPEIFKESIARLNPQATPEEIEALLGDVLLKLDYDDLGRDFYKQLTSGSGWQLFDATRPDRNTYHVTTELVYKNGEENFRPDITVLINGMPLAFIEVKKPNNQRGILAERDRMNTRSRNPRFKHFANIAQLMIFSNNMEYEDGVIEPIQGAYYATSSLGDVQLNYFREEENLDLTRLLAPLQEEDENRILRDNNLISIKYSDEFQVNKQYTTPTNRILTSLLSRERLAFLLKYAIAYVEEETDGIRCVRKHIMRYPQLFATKAIEKRLGQHIRKGIIWHTQGSRKTALAYYNVRFLTDHYRKQGVIPKFYFIVDRIDLADQAATEFGNRGLLVRRVNSRAEFIGDMQTVSPLHNHLGQPEISVVNIQKFSETSVASSDIPYDIRIQRIYFLDEAHRSYNPRGNYLANLVNSNKEAVLIALTGTPLLREVVKDYDTKALFGEYIHTYYYNMSIADGYTRRLIREGIDTRYKIRMQELIAQIQVAQGTLSPKAIFAHPRFAGPMLDYILDDLYAFRRYHQDDTLAAMVVCDSSEQAKTLFAHFEAIYGAQEEAAHPALAADSVCFRSRRKPLRAALILHDVNDKAYRKQQINDFKAGKIDILFVYNMLLTGFDARRLKKLYLARVVQDHNLLQTLTRVNRPYKQYRYGYVVDFADITHAFDRANYNYFKELQGQLGDETETYNQLFRSQEEISREIGEIKDTLFRYDIQNAELYTAQISQVRDRQELLTLLKALHNARELHNLIRYQGYEELLELLDFRKMKQLLLATQARLETINLLEAVQTAPDITHLLNEALEEVVFTFDKTSEHELVLADTLRDQLRRTREALVENIDPKDPAFVSLREELERLFRSHNLGEVSQEEMTENIRLLRGIYERIRRLNRENSLLLARYEQDRKFVRIHKRLAELPALTRKERLIHEALLCVKRIADDRLQRDKNILQNEEYFRNDLLPHVIGQFKDTHRLPVNYETIDQINTLIVNEYYNEYRGINA
ncbi:MAG: DEAD/DEAH box helicase family protein [Bacteroides sp.]|nr:DEAD/DEAH box helicase family protein [Bacteroides sp.]